MWTVIVPALDSFPPVDTTSASAPIMQVVSWVMWCGGIVAVVSFIAAGVSLMLANTTGHASEVWKYLAYVAFGAVVVSAAAAIATAVSAMA